MGASAYCSPYQAMPSHSYIAYRERRNPSAAGRKSNQRSLFRLKNMVGAPITSRPSCENAIPENLLESELFGYEKGSYTGAAKQTLGKIELASGGTFFLDEVGDLPMALQAKLLRFLQERVIERVGGREEIPVDVRVVCATHQNLQDHVDNAE